MQVTVVCKVKQCKMDTVSETGHDSLRHGMLGINVDTPAYYS